MIKPHLAAADAALAILTALSVSPASAKSDQPHSGRATAEMVCSRCHEVSGKEIPGRRIGDGTPPPFGLIARDPTMTPEALRRYIRFPHGAMDNVFLTRRETDALVAYIQSLTPRP